jgi:hypothetical protein
MAKISSKDPLNKAYLAGFHDAQAMARYRVMQAISTCGTSSPIAADVSYILQIVLNSITAIQPPPESN